MVFKVVGTVQVRSAFQSAVSTLLTALPLIVLMLLALPESFCSTFWAVLPFSPADNSFLPVSLKIKGFRAEAPYQKLSGASQPQQWLPCSVY